MTTRTPDLYLSRYDNLSGVPIQPNRCPWCGEHHDGLTQGRAACGATLEMLMHPERFLHCTCGAVTSRLIDCRNCGKSVVAQKATVRAWYELRWPATDSPIDAELRRWANDRS